MLKLHFSFNHANSDDRRLHGDVTHLLLRLFTVSLWRDEGQFKDPWTGRRSRDQQVGFGVAPSSCHRTETERDGGSDAKLQVRVCGGGRSGSDCAEDDVTVSSIYVYTSTTNENAIKGIKWFSKKVNGKQRTALHPVSFICFKIILFILQHKITTEITWGFFIL